MTTFKQRNNVTQLHKGLGPSLFQYRSKSSPVFDQSLLQSRILDLDSGSARCDTHNRRGSCQVKKVAVKCVDRQDENSMFAKRLRERYRPRNYSNNNSKKNGNNDGTRKKSGMEECELFVKEKMFSNSVHKGPAGFPPPSFMPRWNPRHKDRTYAEKIIYEDPWSLSSEDRAELKRKTGLRLKSISRHYQFKVGSNLPLGKDALGTSCTCHVEYCNHCQKNYETSIRCPLHFQILDPVEHDCKTILGEFCPFQRNPEDLPLHEIDDVTVYVSEVVRRLKAGEISEAPPFPEKFLHATQVRIDTRKKTLISSESGTGLDTSKRAEVDECCTQTEPFKVDVDMQGFYKDSITQTVPPEKEEPYMISRLKAPNRIPFVPYEVHNDKGTQVRPCNISRFDARSKEIVRKVATMTMAQSIQELSDEMSISHLEKLRAHYTEQLANFQRTIHFSFMQEKFRVSSYATEEELVRYETTREAMGEHYLAAGLFAQSFFFGFRSNVMESLRSGGFIVNEDLVGIQTVFVENVNESVGKTLEKREDSKKLLDEMINHALTDLELDYFRREMVDWKYLHPLAIDSKDLRELVELNDEVIELIKNVKQKLISLGYWFDEEGKLVKGLSPPSASVPSSSSSSDEEIATLLENIRVSLDSNGAPKYLVDVQGTPLPINPKWLKTLDAQMNSKNFDSTKRFDIILEEESLTELEGSSGKTKPAKSKTSPDFESEEEDFPETEAEEETSPGKGDVDDDDDAGILFFHTSSDESKDVDFSDL